MKIFQAPKKCHLLLFKKKNAKIMVIPKIKNSDYQWNWWAVATNYGSFICSRWNATSQCSRNSNNDSKSCEIWINDWKFVFFEMVSNNNWRYKTYRNTFCYAILLLHNAMRHMGYNLRLFFCYATLTVNNSNNIKMTIGRICQSLCQAGIQILQLPPNK